MALRIISAAAAVAAASLLAEAQTAVPTISGQDANTFWDGTCENYDGVCNGVVNSGTTKRKIFVYTNGNKTQFEELAIFNILDAHDKAGYLNNEQCRIMTDAFVCAAIYFGCDATSFPGEAVPILPCQQFCQDTWDECMDAYNTYLSIDIGKANYMDSKLPNCGPTATFSLSFLPAGTEKVMDADRFGGRLYPKHPIWPMGYKGELKFPPDNARYTNKAGVSKNITCQVPGTITAIIDVSYKAAPTVASSSNVIEQATMVGAVAAAMVAIMSW